MNMKFQLFTAFMGLFQLTVSALPTDTTPNPTFDPSFNPNAITLYNAFETFLANVTHHGNLNATDLETRNIDPNNLSTLYCGEDPGFRPEWEWADWGRIQEGITYLNIWFPTFTRWCQVKARSCVRISCSYGAGIFLCNDQYWDFQITCRDAASYTQWIQDRCWSFLGTERIDKGQLFDWRDFNIIVRGDPC